jgi:FMN phosphatase YigB (HAD superfamily)
VPTLVFLLDVDNTLIDNDAVKDDINEHLEVQMGEQLTQRFWELYEKARQQSDVVNIPLALQWLREDTPLDVLDEETYRHVQSIFDNYPFYDRLYPYALETLRYLRTLGLTVIVSDGDMCFQPEKIYRSDLAETVEGRVLIYIHKQQHLNEITLLYPADHYAMIDDKAQILADSRAKMGDVLTTVFVEQGHYAATPPPDGFTPDIRVRHIGDLRGYTAEQFLHSK